MTEHEILDYLRLVRQMRRCQREYFKSYKDPRLLRDARDLEARVDEATRALGKRLQDGEQLKFWG